MAKKLQIIAGPDAGRMFPLYDGWSTLLGRSRHADSRLADLEVSRVHCEIEQRGERVTVSDLDSAGGTFVNGRRVSEQNLRPGDVVRIGQTQLRLEELALGNQPPPQPAVRPPQLTSGNLQEPAGWKLCHYQVGQVLARGQSGLVFYATDFKSNRPAALKVLWPEFSRNETEIRRFIRSMKTMLPMRHPHLVTLYGAGKTGPYCWIAMEYIDGESLTQVLDRIGTAGMLDWRHAFRVAVHLALVLDYAHKHSIIHRNLTPQNVMVQSQDKSTRLGDLMLAKAQEGELAQQLTRPGEILGDVRYMAPERTGGTNVDERSDLYSLGALLYSLLTGRPPVQARSLVDALIQIRTAEPAPPRKFQLSIPARFEGVVMKLLAKRPEERFQSAVSLLAELKRTAKFQGMKM